MTTARHLIAGIMLVLAFANANAQTINYDESKVRPYTLEDPLRFVDGHKVKSLNDWEKRRTEILQIFQSEMYGQMPPQGSIFTEVIEEGTTLGGFAKRKQVRMWFDSEKKGPKIDWLILVPSEAKGPVPAIISLNYNGNQTVLPDPEIQITDGWLRDSDPIVVGNKATEESRGWFSGQNTRYTFPVGMILARGYAFVTACYGEISPDPDGKEEQERIAYTGFFDMWGQRDPSRKDNTTAVGAWAWTLCRGLDMLEAEDGIDAAKVVVTGCSRLGKAALLAGAYDERFAAVVAIQTGGGGAPLAKRNFGECIATEVNMFSHWYCRAYDKYAGKEETMPFDQHLLLSCVAPRPLLVTGFNEEWFDTKGEFLSLQAASPVWKKFRKSGLPDVAWPDIYDTKAIGKWLGYVRRDQMHGIAACDWTWLMDFSDKHLK